LASGAGIGGGRKLSSFGEERCGVVSEKRTRAGDGDIQRRDKRWGAGDAVGGAVDHDSVWMEMGFPGDGAVGMLWVIAWLALYHKPGEKGGVAHGPLVAEEAEAAKKGMKIPWRNLLLHRQMWAIALGKFMTDPIWWVYLFWIPDFLNRSHGITLSHVGAPLVVIYQAASVGSVGAVDTRGADQARLERESRAEDGNVDLRVRSIADCASSARLQLWIAVGSLDSRQPPIKAGPRICTRWLRICFPKRRLVR